MSIYYFYNYVYILLVLIRQNILGLTVLFFVLAYLNLYGRFPDIFQIQIFDWHLFEKIKVIITRWLN